MFEDLPSSIRSRFENQPSQFLDFVHDENNLQEMQQMGLLNPYYQDLSTDNLEDSSKLEGENTEESHGDSTEKDS
jgi:hypothetical protein